MALLLKTSYLNYKDFILSADERTNDWLFVKSPVVVLFLVVIYLWLVKYYGPLYMKKKNAYDLKKFIVVYNILQIIMNGYIAIKTLPLIFDINWRCANVSYTYDDRSMLEANLCWYFYMTKYVDLLDTVFFVLRKKEKQISFLHVIHHSGIVPVSWFGTKFIAGGHTLYIVFVNSFIHSIMYFYYLLSAYDKKYQKNIILKRTITQAQLTQFAFFIFIFGQTLFRECSYMKFAAIFMLIQNAILICMFGEFYFKTYHNKKTVKSVQVK